MYLAFCKSKISGPEVEKNAFKDRYWKPLKQELSPADGHTAWMIEAIKTMIEAEAGCAHTPRTNKPTTYIIENKKMKTVTNTI